MWRNPYPLNYVLLCKTKKIQVEGRSNSSKTTTPSKSLKHKFEVENEFKDESESNDNHALDEFEVENKFNRVWKFIWLIFICCKSEVSGRSGPEIRSTDLHLLQVRGLRPIGSGNWDWSSSTTSPRSQANSQNRLLGSPSYTKPSL